MSQTVLVPVDGSTLGEHAIPWAVATAGPAGTIHLVHAHVAPVPLLVEGVVVADPTLDATLREQEADYLVKLTERVRAAAPGRTVSTRTLDSDDPPADTLAAAVAEVNADLVVMATHGRGPFARFWLGSVADELLRRSPVPVLLFRPSADGQPNLAAHPVLWQLVVPLDGTELANRIVAPALRLARVFASEVVLLSVAEPGGEGTTPGESHLERVAEEISREGLVVRTESVRHASVAEAVLTYAGNDPTVGVALATHGRSGLSRLLMGSVADEVIRHAVGPVLAFHPPG